MYRSVDVVAHKNGPAIHHSASELGRALVEGVHYGSLWPLLGSPLQGDGHAVMVMPGFLGSDLSTSLLRRYLSRHGFQAQPWQQGRNTGRASVQVGMLQEFLRLTDSTGDAVSLVGHSLGGVFARELARNFPDRVRSVVTLGSPFASANGNSVARVVRAMFEKVSNQSVGEFRDRLQTVDPRQPPGVPSSSIYSRSDGVVHWHSCLEQDSDMTENIEVYGSHCGMVVNASVLQAVADRLAQPAGEWRKFTPRTGLGVRYPQRRAGVKRRA